ncbi:hypothetical protein GIB67_023634 [Kingdonia uniflora]|uniref:Aminotransferase-like plant mobile domain-containing protein n=1 Tax=Kingdonia uniflora TaxID=39325 RepID=A0A7J7L520_9MAGN|nr:hypothetical protein GIB67_023634 [Kingdonia uniflora]
MGGWGRRCIVITTGAGVRHLGKTQRYTMNEKVSPTASYRRKKELAREGDLVTYKRKRKTINPGTVVPPNTVDTANEGEKLLIRVHHHQSMWDLIKEPQVVQDFVKLKGLDRIGAISYNYYNFALISAFVEHWQPETNSFHFKWGEMTPTLDDDLNAFKSLKAEGVENSLSLRKLKEYYAYKLEKSFLFPTKKGTNVSAYYFYLFAKDKVVKNWSWGSAVLAHMYYNLGAISRDDGRQFTCCTTLLEHHEHASLSPNAYGTIQTRGVSDSFDQQITALNDQLQKLKEDKEKESEANINLRDTLKEKLAMLQSHQPVLDTPLAKKYEDLLAAHEDVKKKLIVKKDFRHKLVNAEERMKSLEANNNEWVLVSEGMGDMGDPTFEELFEQNEKFFTIAQQGPKGDYQEDLFSTMVTLENVVIARRKKMSKKIQEFLFQLWTKYLVDVRGVEISDNNSGFRVTAAIQHQSKHRF